MYSKHIDSIESESQSEMPEYYSPPDSLTKFSEDDVITFTTKTSISKINECITINNDKKRGNFVREIGIGISDPSIMKSMQFEIEIGGSTIIKQNVFDYELISQTAKMRDGLLYISLTKNIINYDKPLCFASGLQHHLLNLYIRNDKEHNSIIFTDWSINKTAETYQRRHNRNTIDMCATIVRDDDVMSHIKSLVICFDDYQKHLDNYEISFMKTRTIVTDQIIPRDEYYNSLINRPPHTRRLHPTTITKLLNKYDIKPVHRTKKIFNCTLYNNKKVNLVTSAYTKLFTRLLNENVSGLIVNFLRPKMPNIERNYNSKTISITRSAYYKVFSKLMCYDVARYALDFITYDINKFYKNKIFYSIGTNNLFIKPHNFKIEYDKEKYKANIKSETFNVLRTVSGMSGLLYSN